MACGHCLRLSQTSACTLVNTCPPTRISPGVGPVWSCAGDNPTYHRRTHPPTTVANFCMSCVSLIGVSRGDSEGTVDDGKLALARVKFLMMAAAHKGGEVEGGQAPPRSLTRPPGYPSTDNYS